MHRCKVFDRSGRRHELCDDKGHYVTLSIGEIKFRAMMTRCEFFVILLPGRRLFRVGSGSAGAPGRNPYAFCDCGHKATSFVSSFGLHLCPPLNS